MRAQDVHNSEEEKNEENTSEELECEGGKDAYAHEGALLMIRKILNYQASPQAESHRENIFHTRCKISENCVLSSLTVVRVVIVVVLGWLIN